MNLLSLNQSLSVLFAWTWKTSLEASVLIALVLLAQFTFRKLLPVKWRYLLSLMILVRLLVPALPASHFSIFNLKDSLANPNSPRQTQSLSSPATPVTVTPILSQLMFVPVPRPARPFNWLVLARNIWLLGCAAFLLLVLRQHFKLARWARRQGEITDESVQALLNHCRHLLGVRRAVRMIYAPHLHTPAVFGLWRPCLLLPSGMPAQLSPAELRLVFLHELVHVRRGDVLLNWLVILARSLHWFNPLVWLALQRLRADQELVCDAQVLARLAAGERRLYGYTLLKLLTQYSTARLCPSLVPFIVNKKIIQRRIAMITQYQSATRPALAGSLALLLLLGLITFTRAAEEPADTSPDPAKPLLKSTAQSKLDAERDALKGLAEIQQQLKLTDEKVLSAQRQLEQLQGQSRTSAGVKGAVPSDDATTMQHYGTLRIDAESEYIKLDALLKQLQKLNREQLLQVLPTACPDQLMISLMTDLDKTQVKLAGLRQSYGKDHPKVVEAVATEAAQKQKISDRVSGILMGMETRLASLKAVMDNSADKLKRAQVEDLEARQKYQAELDSLIRFRDVLAGRLAQEIINLDSSRPNQPEKPGTQPDNSPNPPYQPRAETPSSSLRSDPTVESRPGF